MLLETTLEHAQEFISPGVGSLEQTDKGVLFRRAAIQLKGVAHILINLDFPVHVIRPVELRQMLRQLATKALQIADEEG